ncbi:nitrate reductase molybdenum cofactor assembly chaperone [Streptomyces sp. P9-A2]|uniref:nitrate reductase molybdenum cofactor assembly chaperone n=1 Tax=Streptomyces sp. P9-A2 TaxID=3072284 RepID=UPI003FCD915D
MVGDRPARGRGVVRQVERVAVEGRIRRHPAHPRRLRDDVRRALPGERAAPARTGRRQGVRGEGVVAEPDARERHYVETFDLRRRSSLYLTYYLHGDTRRRGMALLTLSRRYRAAGWDTDGAELPDHLPVVLEFAALVGPGAGEAPLRQHRRGLELVHRALTDTGSPYRHVLGALLTLLPPATEADRAEVARLVAEGPPDEEVGLDPYGTHAPYGPYGEGEFAPPGTFEPPSPAVPTRVPPLTPTSRTEGRR